MAGDTSTGFPPFSRLFIIGDKKATEEDYRKTFSKVGEAVTVTFIKDRTGENKGIVYVQMSKTSEACKGVEQLNGVCVGNTTRSMKVLIATNRSETISDEDIMAQVSRLFVVVPKTYSEDDVTNVFEKYGAVKKVVTIKDKRTNESKGLAFVTYVKSSDAANAYENCSSEYKAKFADPISRKRQHDEDERQGGDRRGADRMSMPMNDRMGGQMMPAMPQMSMGRDQGPAEFLANYPHNNQYYLKVRVPKGLTQHQLTRLFNIVPTLEFCRLATNQYSATDIAIIGYSSASCCSYAKEAFHGFEYPPGCPLDIEFYAESARPEAYTPDGSVVMNSPSMNMGMNSGMSTSMTSGMSMGMNNQAPSMQGAGFSGSNTYQLKQEAVPFAPPDSEAKKRLFIVTHPDRISVRLLSDMFSKFGNFISVNYIPGKNYGFAKFASEECADKAQKYMHGETIGGNHLKCLDAEDPPPDNKRSKK